MDINIMPDNILAFTEERKQMYLKLANAFTYPERDMVEELLIEEISLLDLMQGSADEILQSMQIEYTRLFINTAYESLLAPPYESYYRHDRSLLMHPSTIMDLKYLFQQAGLDLAEESELAPDHIAVEFEFMSYLVEEEHEYRKEEDQAKLDVVLNMQKKIIEAHLNVWIFQFFERISLHSAHPLYKKLSQIGQRFLQNEVDYFRNIKFSN
jgi:TorA maturation chaperone TorD